jgi:hypothetical protein
MKLKRFLNCKKGLETVTAVFMLFMLFAVMTGFLVAFFGYNISAQQQFGNEGQRAAEQITMTKFGLAQNGQLYVTIVNTGTTEVKIAALYKTLNGQAIYYFDPTTNNPNTTIPVSKELTLYFPNGVTLNADEKILAATNRGIRTMDQNQPRPYPTPIYNFNEHEYIYGNIALEWEKFEYKSWKNGQFDPNGNWLPGWTLASPERYVAWKLVIKNVGDTDIFLNQQSSFTLEPTATDSQSSPARRSWYLFPASITLECDPDGEGPLSAPSTSVIFVWSTYSQSNYQEIYSQPSVCMVFLTFFGHYIDGVDTPYAQTIPFEATTTIT